MEKNILKKIFLSILIFSFGYQSISKSDEISEFSINGMKVGESLLNYIDEEKILANVQDWYSKKGILPILFDANLFGVKDYDKIEFNVKTNDKNYIIELVAGIKTPIEIENCYKNQKEIMETLKVIFANSSGLKIGDITKYNHGADKSGKSSYTRGFFRFESGDEISIDCNNFSKETGWPNEMYVGIATKEFLTWFESGKSPYE